jgi:hypothetical protein
MDRSHEPTLMALSDIAGGKEGKGAAIAIKVEPPDTLDAAARLLKALESKDAHAVDDALHMWCSAYQEQMGGKGEDAEPEGE